MVFSRFDQWVPGVALASFLSSRMFAFVGAASLALGGLMLSSPDAAAQTAPSQHTAVVELYTAQGCVSCPPADEMMLDLAAREDVIALALHVDYWDYMGWVDELASPAYTHRQQTYARNNGHSTIYTPQVVINGVQIVEGYRVPDVLDVINAELERRPEVSLTLERTEAGRITLRAENLLTQSAPQIAMASRRSALTAQNAPAAVGRLSLSGEEPLAQADEPMAVAVMNDEMIAMADFTVELIRFEPMVTVDIRGGENMGRTAQYANVVTSWETVGGWDLRDPLEMELDVQGGAPVVVVIQEQGQREIIAAAILR